MIRKLNCITLLILWLTCRSLSNEVLQVPSSILGNPQDSATINCSHSISLYNVILWYQQLMDDSNLKLIGYTQYTNPTIEDQFKNNFTVSGDGSKEAYLHILKLRQPEDSGMYYCAASRHTEAFFGNGTKLTVLDPNIPITPPTVKILQPSLKECKDKKDKKNKKTLVCVASGFYPDHVSVFWQIEGENVTDGVATDNATLRDGKLYSITGRLRVPARTWHTPGRKFNCTVSFFNGTHTTYHSGLVYGTDLGQGEGMTREKYLQITQTAKLSYGVFIAKSSLYGVFVLVLVWKLQASSGKQSN
ncbi:M1-specific T cell receptor beta chain-like isoform X7 [Centroberyx gerrardi]